MVTATLSVVEMMTCWCEVDRLACRGPSWAWTRWPCWLSLTHSHGNTHASRSHVQQQEVLHFFCNVRRLPRRRASTFTCCIHESSFRIIKLTRIVMLTHFSFHLAADKVSLTLGVWKWLISFVNIFSFISLWHVELCDFYSKCYFSPNPNLTLRWIFCGASKGFFWKCSNCNKKERSYLFVGPCFLSTYGGYGMSQCVLRRQKQTNVTDVFFFVLILSVT